MKTRIVATTETFRSGTIDLHDQIAPLVHQDGHLGILQLKGSAFLDNEEHITLADIPSWFSPTKGIGDALPLVIGGVDKNVFAKSDPPSAHF